MLTFYAFLIAATLSFVGAFFFRRLALYLSIVDHPGERKVHSEPIPLLGGLGIYLSVILTLVLFQENLRAIMPIFAGGTVMLYMGTYDDIKGLSARLRLLIQVAVSVAVIASGVTVSFMPAHPIGDLIECAVSLIWIVGITNAFNYLDGLDGLASGSAALNLFFLFVILYNTGQFLLGLAMVIIMGACLGFLPHNFFGKRRMFLGDAGSMFIGFCLACIAIEGNWAKDNVVKIFIPVLILGVPIFDMIFTTIMRIKEEKVKNFIEWLRYGGKDHFHHYLVDLGLGQRGAVFFIYYVTFSLGLSAVMVSNDSALEAVLTLMQSSIIFGIIGVLIVLGKRQHLRAEQHK